MSSVQQIFVNSEKHAGAVEVFHNPSSNNIANFAAATGFVISKTHAIGEGAVPYNAGGHYVIRPKLYPQVACHAIFEDGKTQISNKTPHGEIHIIFEGSVFTLENQHEANLRIKHTPSTKVGSTATDTKYLGTFSDAENSISKL